MLLGVGLLALLWYLADWGLGVGALLGLIGLPYVMWSAFAQGHKAKGELGMDAALIELRRRAGWYELDDLVQRQRADLADADARTLVLVVESDPRHGNPCQVVVTVGPEGPARRRLVERDAAGEDERLDAAIEMRRDRLDDFQTGRLRAILPRLVRRGSLASPECVEPAETYVCILYAANYRVAVVAASPAGTVVMGDVPGRAASARSVTRSRSR